MWWSNDVLTAHLKRGSCAKEANSICRFIALCLSGAFTFQVDQVGTWATRFLSNKKGFSMTQCQNVKHEGENAFTFTNVHSHFPSISVRQKYLWKGLGPQEHLWVRGEGKADRLNLGFLCTNKTCLTLKVTRKTVGLTVTCKHAKQEWTALVLNDLREHSYWG